MTKGHSRTQVLVFQSAIGSDIIFLNAKRPSIQNADGLFLLYQSIQKSHCEVIKRTRPDGLVRNYMLQFRLFGLD